MFLRLGKPFFCVIRLSYRIRRFLSWHLACNCTLIYFYLILTSVMLFWLFWTRSKLSCCNLFWILVPDLFFVCLAINMSLLSCLACAGFLHPAASLIKYVSLFTNVFMAMLRAIWNVYCLMLLRPGRYGQLAQNFCFLLVPGFLGVQLSAMTLLDVGILFPLPFVKPLIFVYSKHFCNLIYSLWPLKIIVKHAD